MQQVTVEFLIAIAYYLQWILPKNKETYRHSFLKLSDSVSGI